MTVNPKILSHFGAFCMGLAVLFWAWSSTLFHMLNIIWNVDSYSHGLLVPLVTAGLIWSRKDKLFTEDVRSWMPGLTLLIMAILVWILGESSEIMIISHLGLVIGIQALILICFGPTIFRRILFPCLFLFLAIPVGDQLIPLLQTVTAELVITILGWLGIAHSAEGVLITLPSGVYEVARACAGIKFLFTSLVTGALLANLAYQSIKGRIAIMVVAFILPVFANAVRVLGILLIAEATDASFAKGVDHLVYGWGFLSVVLLLLIAIAYRFSDRDEASNISSAGVAEGISTREPLWWAAPSLAIAILLVSAKLAPETFTQGQILALDTVPPECSDCDFRLLVSETIVPHARLSGADKSFQYLYRSAADTISIEGALYCPQRKGSRLIQIENSPGGEDWSWLPGVGNSVVAVGDWRLQKRIYWRGLSRKTILVGYVVNGQQVASEFSAKLETAKERLFDGRSVGEILVITGPTSAAGEPTTNKMEKFLSTFPRDRFLWDSVKSKSKDQNLCVA